MSSTMNLSFRFLPFTFYPSAMLSACLLPFTFCLLPFTFFSLSLYSQQKKGTQIGLYTGAFFPNNSTATLYDGYGYNLDGKKNSFEDSYLNRKINYEYGGANGQPDRIAQELGLNSNEWIRITPKDMPVNMRYTPAFMFGMAVRYNLNETSSLLLNLQSARFSATGNFTIETTPSVNSGTNTWKSQNIRTFSIIGTEQRFMLQAGLQRFLSHNEIFNFFVEAGPVFNMVKIVKNQAIINNLQIDMMRYYDVLGNQVFQARNMTAVDFGFFAGAGINLNTNTGWIVQVLYNPSYERMGIGEKPGPFLQHALGLRMYKAKWEEGE